MGGTFDDPDANDADARALTAALEHTELSGEAKALAEKILLHRDQLGKKTVWLFGGDGWPMTSVTADWITSWPPARTSKCL